MVDRHYCDPALTALYDAFCAGRPDFDFYLPLVMSARRVLDVGCGTGELLRLARAQGHEGELCGLDPAPAMLDVARACTEVEWVHGDLTTFERASTFDLVVMTGHAFQVLVDDAQIRTALRAVARILTSGGRFVFETRNPGARAWELWTPDRAVEVIAANGETVQMAHEVGVTFDGYTVSFATTYTSRAWAEPVVSRSTLRFLDAPALDRFVEEAGLSVEAQYGDWDQSALVEASPEIITVATIA